MKVYSVSYNAGLGGTWLTWFINQHKGFQNYDAVFKPHKLDYSVGDELMWYWKDYDWNETVKRNVWNDKSNVVYKLFPSHDWIGVRNEFEGRDDEMLLKSNTIGIVVPYVNEELKSEFVQRNVHTFNTTVERAVLNIDWGRIHCTSSDVNRNCYTKYSNLYNVVTIDMGKLLNCNRHEYARLLKLIHTPEHPQYEQMCAEYKNNVFLS